MEREEAEKQVDENWNEFVNEDELRFYGYYLYPHPTRPIETLTAGGMELMRSTDDVEDARKKVREMCIEFEMARA